jgi:hypothetical protein
MTIKEIEDELEREPYIPLRLHLDDGKTVDLPRPGVAWTMRHSLLVFQPGPESKYRVTRYDIISLRHVVKIEQLNGKDGH